MNTNQKVKLISISANIAAGKSTLIGKLKTILSKEIEDGELVCVKEPTEQWSEIKDEDGKSVFEKFYGDQKNWSFMFQLCAITTRLEIIRETLIKNPKVKVIVTERSPEDDRWVFTELLHKANSISKFELEWFDRIRKIWVDEYYPNLVLNIHLDVSVENCFDRLVSRGRVGEGCITKDYLRCVEDEMKTMFIRAKHDGVEYLHLDGNCHLDSKEYTSLLYKLVNVLEQKL